ncbi:beta propeller domain-containing protein [Prauserella shujinwangii]|uniref:Beta propeller domain-containing protein n=1 Tax=Prauserella shujinwangii TaxID=1453103 RepID=A0A2T0LW60_9PSEU|nr:beta-propeller domain-containing protein [Prauserella shujinwangii]PRX48254.1 beta propeller domain-containing protein [Prauserella shujinwangii]
MHRPRTRRERELREAAKAHVGPFGFGGANRDVGVAKGAAESAPATADKPGTGAHSATNNQAEGVGEPDVVQTDGRRVVTVADGGLRVADVATRQVTSTLDIPGGATELLLHGDRALVFGPPARVTLVDLAGPARILGTLDVTGSHVDARAVGGTVRVVVSSAPRLPFVQPDAGLSAAAAERGNHAVLERATVDDWLPCYTLTTPDGGTTSGRLVECSRISHPRNYRAASLLTVLTFDLAGELGTGDPVAVVADGQTVYGTASALYVAHQRWQAGSGAARTELYQFDLDTGGPPEHVASGAVEGALLNQYALSEHDGHLRVATTTGSGTPDGPGGSESRVTVLERRGSRLAETGLLTGLGPGERIYAVRFAGPVGYVVTFRQTDPLYTLDLSDPARPRAVGELKITGYSAYLHPVGQGRLIGVGQEADRRGVVQGLQVSLFDVTDPAAPRRVTQYRLDGGWAQVEADPRAFLYWEPSGLLVLPTHAEALVLRVAGDRITELGRSAHPTRAQPVRRAVVLGAELWTVSGAGILVHDATTMTPRQWLPFR